MRAAIAGIRSSNPPDVGATALRTIGTIVGNIIRDPHEAKYRTLKRSNAAFDRRVGSVPGAAAFLRSCGFTETAEGWELNPTENAWNLVVR